MEEGTEIRTIIITMEEDHKWEDRLMVDTEDTVGIVLGMNI